AGGRMGLLDEEFVAVELRRDPEALAQEFEDLVVLDVVVFIDLPEHPDAGEDQERTEEEQDGLESVNQRHAHADQDGAENQDADDAPEQHAVLIETRYA